MNLESVLFYQYDETTIQYNEKSPESDGYLKTPFISKPNNPSIRYNNTNYKTETLYIFKNIHKEFPECQGVLVIEHSPITNGFQKIYLCFPLRTDKTSFSNKTSIDSVFETGSSTINMMNYMTPDMEFITYENKGIIYSDLVVLSNKPILIKTDLSKLTKPPSMFSDHTDDFIIITPQRIIPGMPSIEGMTEGMDDVPVYCTPVDESGTELEASLTIPVLGQYSETLQSSKIIYQMMNYVGALVLFGIVTGITPLIYAYVILKLVGNVTDDDEKKGKTTAIIILFAIWFGASIIMSFSYATMVSNQTSSFFDLVIGLFFFFLLLCFGINILVFHRQELSSLTGAVTSLLGFFYDLYENIQDRGGELLVYVVVCAIIGTFTGIYSNPANVPLYIVYLLPIVIIIYQLSGIKSGGRFAGLLKSMPSMPNISTKNESDAEDNTNKKEEKPVKNNNVFGNLFSSKTEPEVKPEKPEDVKPDDEKSKSE